MKNRPGMKNTARNIILTAAIATGMALMPAAAMAKNADHGQHHGNHSTSIGKHHTKGHRSKHELHDRHAHHPRRHERRHAYKHHGHRHNHGLDHRHYVVNEYYYDDYDLDYLRFMIGLHTDKLDIIVHE